MSNPPDINWNDMSQVQAEITRWAQERFPHRTDHHAIHKLMVEEIPEMAMHKKEHGTGAIGTELADCFILLFDLASLWKVDMAQAIFDKMRINYARQWKPDAHGIMQHEKETPLRHCTNPNMTQEAARMLVAIETGRCRFYPDCLCGHGPPPVEPARATLIYCPNCRSCANTRPLSAVEQSAACHQGAYFNSYCSKCDTRFDDTIPF